MLSIGLSQFASASIITNGDGTFTDDQTGYVWRDIDETTNISYDDMLTKFGSGGAFEGYRHASLDEVREMFSSAGLPLGQWPHFTYSKNDNSGAVAIAVTGSTVSDYNLQEAYGITSDLDLNDGRQQWARFGYQYFGYPWYRYDTLTDTGLINRDFGSEAYGHWLILESSASFTIPEPTTVAVWSVLGIAGMGFYRGRKKSVRQ